VRENVDILMNPKFKLGAYAILVILAVWFGLAFRYNYEAATSEPSQELSESASVPATPPGTNAESTNTDLTNAIANITNALTNLTAQTTNTPGDVTNAAVGETNVAAAEIATNAPPAKHEHEARRILTPADAASARRAMIGYLGGLIVALIALGMLIAYDVTQLVGSQVTDYLFLDVGDAMRDPMYEEAEALWANAKYLEAIQLLREYLKKNPREMHAALRIGEIYEKDLKNYLAAALEYEEVLKHKLPAEKWGWSAIHLCNLYSKLNQQDKTLALLHRIVQEYPKTGAARKARVRLGIQEIEEESQAEQSGEAFHSDSAASAATGATPSPPPAEDSSSNLPPGFRPRK
jgi:TolA-binding protein